MAPVPTPQSEQDQRLASPSSRMSEEDAVPEIYTMGIGELDGSTANTTDSYETRLRSEVNLVTGIGDDEMVDTMTMVDIGDAVEQVWRDDAVRVHSDDASVSFVSASDVEYSSESEDDAIEFGGEEEFDDLGASARLNEAFEREAINLARNLTDEEMKDIRTFNYKVDTMLKDHHYAKLERAFPELAPIESIKVLQRSIGKLAGMKSVPYDCCLRSCICFTGPYASLKCCPYCKSMRYSMTGRPQKQFHYLPMAPRLQNIFSNREEAMRRMYRSNYDHRPGQYSDVFSGVRYQDLCFQRVRIGEEILDHCFFSDSRDIAIGISFDGFCPFKRRKQTCWPIIAFDYNLPPEERFLRHNIIPLGVIPGPKQMKDTDSFLLPFVEECIKLARGVQTFDAVTGTHFKLHVYLLLAFGDIPAVAKLMRMKGVNAFCPCRMCGIQGISRPNQRTQTYYVPLSRPGSDNYDPLNLPNRTHRQFMQDAGYVSGSATYMQEKVRSRDTGIKGIPILSYVPGIEFPGAFPADFMHLIWENIIPELVDLWCGQYKGLDEGDESYHILNNVIKDILQGIVESGSTIPTSYGCRTPDFLNERGHYTAEAWSMFTLFLGPVLLRGRFQEPSYYKHYMKLVILLKICLQLTITEDEIVGLETGFAEWVQEFERIYFQHNLDRLPVCTLPLHYLLHISTSIRQCGPVWCYWAFPMERFCGFLLPAIGSRKHPFRSLDRRVLELAQLHQIKTLYGLAKELDLSNRRQAIKKGLTLPEYLDRVLCSSPRREMSFSVNLQKRVIQSLAFLLNKPDTLVKASGCVKCSMMCWGKMKWEGEHGDTVHAKELVHDTGRDMSFIRYTNVEDLNARFRNLRVELRPKSLYGQLMRLVIVTIPSDSRLVSHSTDFLLAVIKPCKLSSRTITNGLVQTYTRGQFNAVQVIDAGSIDSVAGRVLDRGEEIFVERPGSWTLSGGSWDDVE